MTHVFVVDRVTFKYHLEYLFAGTGAKDKKSPFLSISNCTFNSITERMLVNMVADISRVRINDKVIFYLQASNNNPGMFFGVFKVVTNPFFDENDEENYLVSNIKKGLSFRVLLEADVIYPKGITEHEFLDSLKDKEHPYNMCWSLIYRKLKGNRGCTMIMDYEYEDLLNKLKIKNNNNSISYDKYTFDENKCEIVKGVQQHSYSGRQLEIDILPRLLYKACKKNAFESHLQAYIIQNFDKPVLSKLLIPIDSDSSKIWIGNEVSCGVGMQRIDILIQQEIDNDVYIKVIELKCVRPEEYILTQQLPWYIEWMSDYVIPNYICIGKKVHLIPCVIALDNYNQSFLDKCKQFSNNSDINCDYYLEPLEFITVKTDEDNIYFEKVI